MTLADQIVVLNRGKIQQIAAPQKIYAQPVNQMVSTFLGSPPMNILQSTYDDEASQVDRQSIPCPDRLRALNLIQGQRLNLGIRPEHIQIASSAAHLTVEVIVVEPLGREILVRTMLTSENLGEAAILSLQMSLTSRPKVGDRLPLQLDLNRLYIFDLKTGKNLSVMECI